MYQIKKFRKFVYADVISALSSVDTNEFEVTEKILNEKCRKNIRVLILFTVALRRFTIRTQGWIKGW